MMLENAPNSVAGHRLLALTFLKKGEERGGYKVRLWKTATGDHFVLYPNLNVRDPAWRGRRRAR